VTSRGNRKVKNIALLALSGSLRANSYNTLAISALRLIAPTNIRIEIGRIDQLPLFNPDREGEPIASLIELKMALSKADGIIIATPEYAHGISGPMKNALDWLVSGAEFPNKPIMLVNTSPRARHAQAALREVLVTMSGCIIEDAYINLPLLGSNLDCQGILAQPQLVAEMHRGLSEFYKQILDLKLNIGD